jgi:hypothetical protein
MPVTAGTALSARGACWGATTALRQRQEIKKCHGAVAARKEGALTLGDDNMTGFILRALITASDCGSRPNGSMACKSKIHGPGAPEHRWRVNAIVRPLTVILTFPITIVTLGLFLLVVNAYGGARRLAAAQLLSGGVWPAF